MKNEHKIILVKFVIALSGLLLISSLGLGITSEMGVFGKNSQIYNNIAYLLFGLLTIVGIIMIILMTKIDIRPPKTKSAKYKINVKDYNELKEKIFDILKLEEYDELNTYKGELYHIDYIIKSKYIQSTVVALIKIKEMTEEIYNQYKEKYFEDFGNYLLETKQLKAINDFKVIYIICVDRVTDYFSKYTEGNIKQHFGRYILPVGISFASKTLYIATQKEGFGIGKYKKLKKEFLTYIDNIIKYD